MKDLQIDGLFSRRAGLRQNPDFSGFASRKIWIPVLPGLAGSHVAEAARFPDLLVRMSRKPPASRTCWFASSFGVFCRGGPWSCEKNVRTFRSGAFPSLHHRRGAQARCLGFAILGGHRPPLKESE